MPTFRVRAIAILAVMAGMFVMNTPLVNAATRLVVVVTDAEGWQAFAQGAGGDLALGVYPDSRDPLRFIEEIGTGAPTGHLEARSPLRGRRGALSQALVAGGIDVTIDVSEAPAELRLALLRGFGAVSKVGEPADIDVAYIPRDAAAIRRRVASAYALVIGLGTKTPVWIASCVASCASGAGVLTGGIARRPGIVTPYDISATILDYFRLEHSVKVFDRTSGLRTVRFIGNTLHPEPDQNALARVRRLAAHLERGAGLGATMGATTTLLAIGALIVGLLLRRGRGQLSARAGQAAGIAVLGYLVALFVPSGNGTHRALVITAVIVAGSIVGFRVPSRAMGRFMLAAAAVFAVLVLAAPLRPGGLPGAAIWGNPLISWRFTGLQNFEVSFLAVAVVVWAVLAELKPLALGVVGFAATVIIGAPTVGSNFVGVLTIAFGASLAVFALARRRVELWQAVTSVVIASAAFAVSLVADSASPVSHGGRAARRISEGGFSTLVDFVQARLRLNLDLIRSFKAGTGFILVAMMLAVIALLMVWGGKPGAQQTGRIAAWAGASMALSSLVLEDSGFYSGPIMLVAAAAAWMIVTASGEEGDLSSSDPASAGGG